MSGVEPTSRIREVVRRTEVMLAIGATVASIGAAAVVDVSLRRDWNSLIAPGLGAVVVAGVAVFYLAGPIRLRQRTPTGGYIALAIVSLTAAGVVLVSGAPWLAPWRFTAAATLATLPNWWVVAMPLVTRDG